MSPRPSPAAARRAALLVPLLALGALLVQVVPVAPASAADQPASPVISDIDTSTPGHVTGTVTSDQPSVYVRVGGDLAAERLTLQDGRATFDLETWGETPHDAAVEAAACRTAPPVQSTDCSIPASAPYVPHDVEPTITYSPDGTLGPGQRLEIGVDDAGGGDLSLTWQGTDGWVDVPLPHEGTVTPDLPDGRSTLHVLRCSRLNAYHCVDYPALEHQLEIRSTTTVELSGAVVTAGQTSVDITATTPRRGTIDLAWRLVGEDGAMGGSGRTGPLALDDAGRATFPLDVSGLSDGSYGLDASITLVDPDFGTYRVGASGGSIRVDRTAPRLTRLAASTTTLYPAIDDAAHPARVVFDVAGDLEYQDLLRITDAAGRTVATLDPDFVSPSAATVTWDGVGSSGVRVPAGRYRAAWTDLHGNASSPTRVIEVDDRRLIARAFRFTVSEAGARTGRTSYRGAVTSSYRKALPAADSHADARVDSLGGAAASAPRSTALLRYRTVGGTTTGDTTLTSRSGTHTGRTVRGAAVVGSDGVLRWTVRVPAGQRYSLRSFTVVVHYTVLG